MRRQIINCVKIFLFLINPLIALNVGYNGYGYEPDFKLDSILLEKVSKKNCHVFAVDLFNVEIKNHKLYDTKNQVIIDKLIFLGFLRKDIGKIQSIHQNTDCKLILFIYEPPTVCPEYYEKRKINNFDKIYTFQDDIIDNKKFFKFYYDVKNPMCTNSIKFENKKLCCLSTSKFFSNDPNELYSERLKAIEFFEKNHPEDFSFGGKRGWEKCEYPRTFKGLIQDKTAFLQQHKFCVCYENTKELPGYVTEKIFDCFKAGCIPIYWGAPNITDYIPPNCFIDKRDFSSYEKLYDFISSMQEEEYNIYIQNIENYLESPKAEVYSREQHLKLLEFIILN